MRFLKLVLVLLVAAGGFVAGGYLAQESGELEPVIGAGLGAALGFVLGLLIVRFKRAAFTVAVFAGIGLGVYFFFPKGGRQIGPYVDVIFEIRATGTSASCQYGIDHGPGTFMTVFEGVESRRMTVRVGQPVSMKAVAHTGPNSSSWYHPSHELICRILVKGDEIYMGGDQGTRNDPAEVACGGPVYIPRDKKK